MTNDSSFLICNGGNWCRLGWTRKRTWQSHLERPLSEPLFPRFEWENDLVEEPGRTGGGRFPCIRHGARYACSVQRHGSPVSYGTSEGVPSAWDDPVFHVHPP